MFTRRRLPRGSSERVILGAVQAFEVSCCRMSRYICWLLALSITLAWVTPVHFLPWVTWHSEVPVFAAVLIAASWLVAVRMAKKDARVWIDMPSMAVAFLLIAALAVLQAAAGIVRFYGDAWAVLLYMVLCAAAFMLGHAQGRHPSVAISSSTALAWTLLLAGVGCTVVALVQAVDVWDTSAWIVRTPSLRRSGSNLAQPNQMATLLLMGAASLAYLYERHEIGARVATLVGVLLAIGLATTESRTGLLSVAGIAAWWACRGYESRLSRTAVATAILLVLATYGLWPPLIEAFHGQAGAQSARVNTQVGFRAIVWPQLLEAAAQKPWLGWGVRQTSSALTSVVHSHPVSEPYTYAHNIVLELLLAFGAPIALVLLGGGAFWTWRRWGARREAVGWYCMAVWVPLIIHAFLEFPYSYAYLLAPAMFALGLLDGVTGVAPPRRVPSVVVAGVLAFTWVIAIWSVVDYVRVEEDFRVARFEAGRIGTTPTEYGRPRIRLLTQLGAMVEAARIVPTPGMSVEQLALAGDVAARFPWPALQNRYALSLALNGQPAAAERELRVLLAMHGEGMFREIRSNWQTLENDKYPQLAMSRMPALPATAPFRP